MISTFGAMFAPDHSRAAAELVRVCRPGGRIAMTTWAVEGFIGELFKLSGAFLPPPPGVEPPPLWGVESHVAEVFGSAGASPAIERESIDFSFSSEAEAVRRYAEEFGPFVVARAVLEPRGRWDEFLQGFAGLVRRFNVATDGTAQVRGDYLLILLER